MKIYVAFDDTDTIDCGRGTGKLARWYEDKLPASVKLVSIVRQQLLVRDDIPYTSHNSSLVCVVEADDDSVIPAIISSAADHIAENFVEGSDPGLCVCSENNPALEKLVPFGQKCLIEKVTQTEAHTASEGAHLTGHGGTNDGVIGAAAGVGLTFNGMHGRFNEWIHNGNKLRDIPETTTAGFLRSIGIELISMERSGSSPKDEDAVMHYGWLRPLLFMKKAVLPVILENPGQWGTAIRKKGTVK